MKKSILLLISITLVACGNTSKNSETSSKITEVADEERSAMMTTKGSGSAQNQTVVNDTIGRLLIKEGQLSIEVSSVKGTKIEIEKLTKKYAGYISSENEQTLTDRIEHSLSIRIPSKKYDAFVKQIESLAKNIDSKSVLVEDVTAEYIDTQVRLKTKSELENRYREILKQARNIEEILSVETQLNNVRSEIESMQGRLKFLSDRISMSTLTVMYYQKIGTDFGFASKFVNAIKEGWDNLLAFLIGLVYLWPFVVIASTVLWVLTRLRKRRKQKN